MNSSTINKINNSTINKINNSTINNVIRTKVNNVKVNNVKVNNVKVNSVKVNSVKVNSVKVNSVKVNSVKVNSVKVNSINKKKEKRKIDKKKWKQFKSNYTFLILALLIYALRPLHINSNNEELSYMTEIISNDFNIENYKEKLNEIIIYITTSFISMNSNSREKIMKKSKTKDKILHIIKLLLNVSSYNDFYSKMITYEPILTDNKDFFNFISSLISFSNLKKSLNREKSVDTVIYLIKRVQPSLLNKALSKVNNQINNQINGKKNSINNIGKYKDLLIKVAESFFKNMAKNDNINFVNSKVVFKKNINTIPLNSNYEKKNNKFNQINELNQEEERQIGGNMNKSVSVTAMVKNMWWLKKYR